MSLSKAATWPAIPVAKARCAPEQTLGAGLITLFTLANVGAYIAFIPLLQILVPLQAAAIDPSHSAALLSRVYFFGALAAGFGNLLFGALSDRSRRRTGSRRNWLFAGLAAVLVTYVFIWRATAPSGLFAGVIAFQFAFNALFAPLGAVLADHVPDRQKGFVSALLGLGYPLGNLVGTQAVGHLLAGETARYGVLAALVTVLVLPFAFWIGRARKLPPQAPARQATLKAKSFIHFNFFRALIGRLLVVTALSLVQGYLLLYLRQTAGSWDTVSSTPEAALAELVAITTCVNIVLALVSGFLSDRFGHRSMFVFAGGASIAVGIVCLAYAHDWPSLVAASIIYGGGAGIYYAVDLALIVQVLPALQNAGKDLGIVNLSNTIPQMVAPLIALRLLDGPAPLYRSMFLVGAAIALLGAICIVGIRVRASPESGA